MKNGLKKEDSLLIYGIAILFMIYHHLFVWGGGSHFSILDTIFGEMTEQRLAWLFRLCIPLYAFISGYGICTIISKDDSSKRCSTDFFASNYKLALKQIFKLLKKYWLVFIIFIPAGSIFLNQPTIGPKTFPLAIIGLGNHYNSEWWYIKQYMMMVLLFPIFDFLLCNLVSFTYEKIIKKYNYGKQLVLGFVLIAAVLLALFRNAPIFDFFIEQLDNGVFVFTLVFFVGFLCAFFHLFELGANSPLYQKIRPFLAVIMLLACCSIRWIRAYDAMYCKYDAFIIAPIVYSLVTLCSLCKPLSKGLQQIGKYSTYMWLTHTFFCNYYFSHWIKAGKVSIVMFILTTALSLATAFLLTKLEKLLGKAYVKFFKKS